MPKDTDIPSALLKLGCAPGMRMQEHQSGIKGLVIRVMRSGTRFYVLRWSERQANGKATEKKRTLGEMDVLPFAKAKSMALEKQLAVHNARHEDRPVLPTLAELFQQADEILWRTTLKSSTAHSYRQGARLFEEFHHLPIDRIDTACLRDMYFAATNAKDPVRPARARPNGGRTQAAAAFRGPLANALAYALNVGYLPANPLVPFRRLKLLGDKRKRRVRIPDAFLGAFIEQVNARPPAQRLLLLTLLFTGWRSSIVLAMRWDRFNWTGGSYKILRSDIGSKFAEDWFAPLPAFLVQEFRALKAMSLCREWCFPSHADSKVPHIQAIGRTVARLAEKAGIPTPLCPHDLRRTFVTANTRVNNVFVAKILNSHFDKAVPDEARQSGDYALQELGYIRAGVEAASAELWRLAKVPRILEEDARQDALVEEFISEHGPGLLV